MGNELYQKAAGDPKPPDELENKAAGDTKPPCKSVAIDNAVIPSNSVSSANNNQDMAHSSSDDRKNDASLSKPNYRHGQCRFSNS